VTALGFSPIFHLPLWKLISERRMIMGIDKKLVKLWKENHDDVVTAFKVLKQLDILKEEDTVLITEKLDIVAKASSI